MDRRRALLAASQTGEESGNNYFTVIYVNENKNYIYEEGMTWGEFINSDYNIEGWEAVTMNPWEPDCVYSGVDGAMFNEDESYVYVTDVISNKNYYLG